MCRSVAANLCTAMLVTIASGCGTMANLKAEPSLTQFDVAEPRIEAPKAFGGVERDLCAGVFSLAVATQYPSAALYCLAALADLPLSFSGDFITLPVVLTSPRLEDPAVQPKPVSR
jgi:hypothetical protein